MTVYVNGAQLAVNQFDEFETDKVFTFDNTATGTYTLFTVTGLVLIKFILSFCTTGLVQSAPTATASLGVTGAPLTFVGATNVDNIDTDEWWNGTSPVLNDFSINSSQRDKTIFSDIILTISGQTVTSGQVVFHVLWQPLSFDGIDSAVTAA